MISSASEFKRLRESSDPSEYLQAAMDEAPIEVWEEIVETMAEMRFWVAQNKTVPVEILSRLACCDDPHVRRMVARKRKITEPIAILLARDADETVRVGLAYNAKLPDSVRDILRGDLSLLVRDALEISEERRRR